MSCNSECKVLRESLVKVTRDRTVSMFGLADEVLKYM